MSFDAKYRGICGSCTEAVRVGDEVTYLEDELVHIDCDMAAPVERPREVCLECFIQKPCGCEVGR